jgi:hypothetical protein
LQESASDQPRSTSGEPSRWKVWVLFGLAFVAGLATFLGNLRTIGDILGLTKAPALKVSLLYDSLGFDGGAFDHPGDWLVHLKAVKSGPGSARHCKIEIQYNGRPMTIRRAPYGESFSLPDGDVVREVWVAVVPLQPSPRFGMDDIHPKASMFCDDIASQELEIPVPARYLSHDPT